MLCRHGNGELSVNLAKLSTNNRELRRLFLSLFKLFVYQSIKAF